MTFRYDGHGHSTYSDGKDTPETIVRMAVEKGVTILGLSDHDSVSGLPTFLTACAAASANGHRLLAIPSIEVTTKQGHMVALFPFPAEARQLIADFPKWKKHADASTVIDISVREYRGLCVFVHPCARPIDGATLEDIDEVRRDLHPSVLPFVGIEIHNWMAHLFFLNRKTTDERVKAWNETRHMPQLYFTDYHRANHAGNFSTLLDMTSLTPEAFVDAFVHHRTAPALIHPSMRHRWEAYISTMNEGTWELIKRKYLKSYPRGSGILEPNG